MPTEAERNYETMRMATREVQAAMERAAGELLRERELADALGRALEAVSVHVEGSNRDFDMGIAIATALRQWREARSAL